MTLAASRWTMLEQGMKEEKQWLIVAQQRVPDLTNVTSMDHEQYINLYQSISLDVSHHYAKMLRLMSITEGLQNLIMCTGLQSEYSTALDTLLKLQEDVDSRLTRLTAFRENWVTYDHYIDRIEGWMRTANRELENLTPENINTTGNLRRFWELKAQHEVYNNLKNESGIQFEKALEILPISDEMVQRQFFSNVEDSWRSLAARIGDIHNTAIQNISDRDVSSNEKLHIIEDELKELRASLDSLKGVIKSEDELNLYIERLQVMTSRIDRILNELSRLSLLPTAESERLGALLTQSGILDDQISEELERSLILKEKIVQVQSGILRCQKSQRRARLTLEECESAEGLGSDVVERASENCDRLMEDLTTQWQDILALRQALHTLPTSLRVCMSPVGVEKDISALQVCWIVMTFLLLISSGYYAGIMTTLLII
jgi:nesprin-1